MLIWELIGTLMGAGFASGREIASFFARYGLWGYGGAILAAAMLGWLVNTDMPEGWRGRWPTFIWQALTAALFVSTGGAMLSGAGEVAALVLPVRGAYWLGMGITLTLSWMLAFRTVAGLAWTSKVMLTVFVCVMIVGFLLPEGDGAILYSAQPSAALARGICYGGFNAALLLPVAGHHVLDTRKKRCSVHIVSLITLGLLVAGIAVLQRHSQVVYESMPFVILLKRWGKWGYYLSACCLYSAVLSTLTACIRSLGQKPWSAFGIVLVALLGFNRVVDHVYTVLGGACMFMILMAKFTNCSRKAFISRKDML